MRRRRSTGALRLAALLTGLLLLATTGTALAADDDPLPGADCERLADMIATACPRRCVQRHCSQRCVPPLSANDGCARCQDRCGLICDRQSERRLNSCQSPAPADTEQPSS